MRVVGDLTTNHSGSHHEWFAAADHAAPEASFYYFNAHPDDYVGWFGLRSLPKFDLRSDGLRRRLVAGDDSIVRRWLDAGLDGWRIDVANMTGRHGTIDVNHEVGQIYYAFVHRGFAAIRFNFRGVGRSQGSFDHGTGELSDAASALDWAQSINPEARTCWIAGFSFGAWIGMQLLMRRPEIEGFISIAPPANLYDFSFLAPCPSSGLIVHGDKDAVVPHKDVTGLVDKLKTQKGIVIEQKVIPGANHFFDGKVEPLMQSSAPTSTSDSRATDRVISTVAPTTGDPARPPLPLKSAVDLLHQPPQRGGR